MNLAIWVSIGLAGFSMLASFVQGIFLFAINRTVQKIDQDKADSKAQMQMQATRFENQISSLSTTLHDANTKLIDERFRTVTHQVNEHANAVALRLGELRDNVKAGDTQIDGLGEVANEIKLNVALQIGTLREHMAKTFADRSDMRHQEENVESKLSAVTERLSNLAGKVEAFSDVTAAILQNNSVSQSTRKGN